MPVTNPQDTVGLGPRITDAFWTDVGNVGLRLPSPETDKPLTVADASARYEQANAKVQRLREEHQAITGRADAMYLNYRDACRACTTALTALIEAAKAAG